MNILEIHATVKEWIEKNQRFIDFDKKYANYHTFEYFKTRAPIQRILNWFYSIDIYINAYKEYFNESKCITEKDIKEHVINRIDTLIKEYDVEIYDVGDPNDNYDYDGYPTLTYLNKLRNLWNNFDDDDVYTTILGYNEEDLDGGRMYILTNSQYIILVFLYIYYKCNKKTIDEYGIIIYNDQMYNEIGDFYPPNIEILDKDYNEITDRLLEEEKQQYADFLISYPKDMNIKNNALELEHFDENFKYYKLKIPFGGKPFYENK